MIFLFPSLLAFFWPASQKQPHCDPGGNAAPVPWDSRVLSAYYWCMIQEGIHELPGMCGRDHFLGNNFFLLHLRKLRGAICLIILGHLSALFIFNMPQRPLLEVHFPESNECPGNHSQGRKLPVIILSVSIRGGGSYEKIISKTWVSSNLF